MANQADKKHNLKFASTNALDGSEMAIPRKVLYQEPNGAERIGLLIYVIEDAALPFVILTRSKWTVEVDKIIERDGTEVTA